MVEQVSVDTQSLQNTTGINRNSFRINPAGIRNRLQQYLRPNDKILAEPHNGSNLPDIERSDNRITIDDTLKQVEGLLIDPETGLVRGQRRDNEGQIVQETMEHLANAKLKLKGLPVSVVGSGTEAVVIRFDDQPTVVFKYLKEKGRHLQTHPLEPLELYHLHAALSIIDSEHFPQVYSVRVGKSVTKGRWQWVQEASEEEFPDVKDQLSKRYFLMGDRISSNIQKLAGLSVRLDSEGKVENFIVDNAGQIKYVDNVIIDLQPAEIDNDKLNQYLSELKLTQPKNFNSVRRHILAYIELETAKFAWINNYRPESEEFAQLRGELSDRSWQNVTKYFNYMAGGNFDSRDFQSSQYPSSNSETVKPFTLTSKLAPSLQETAN